MLNDAHKHDTTNPPNRNNPALMEECEHERVVNLSEYRDRVSGVKNHADSPEELAAVLAYNRDNGTFIWKVRVADGVPAGTPAGRPMRNGQVQINYKGETYAGAHVAWAIATGRFPVDKIRYLNGDPCDLRLSNLAERGILSRNDLTAERVRMLYSYDADTGVFVRLIGPGRGNPKVASKSVKPGGGGYLKLGIDGAHYMAQRIAWLYVYGEFPNGQIEPRDGDQSNMRIANWAIRRIPLEKKKRIRAAGYKRWREANPDKVRGNNLRINFGISVEDYMEIHRQQNGVCAICKRPETNVRFGKVQWLAVDHCHISNGRRELLCGACNAGLGLFSDDPDRMEIAAAYVRRHSADHLKKKAAA